MDFDMQKLDWQTRDLLVYEAVVRRAALLGEPFMLKGSMVTRQYFPDPSIRAVADLDWVYLERLEEKEKASAIFSNWLRRITLMDMKDGICFRDFRENQFWRMMDYAMSEDFPTVNTDIAYRAWQGYTDEISLDVSFNLDINVKPTPLVYVPLYGDPFTIPFTPPLSLQVAWKLHQTVVRPRYKDVSDLCLLLQHASYGHEALEQTLAAFSQEWHRDNCIYPNRVKNLFMRNLDWVMNTFQNPDEKQTVKTLSGLLKQAGFHQDAYQKVLP